jgi:MFS family permease
MTIEKFQFLMAVLFIISFNCGGILFLNLNFLELFPTYLCKDLSDPIKPIYSCKPIDFCNKPGIGYMIDYSNPASLHNWVEDLNLTCLYVNNEGTRIGLIGSLYFAGCTTSAATLPRFSDIWGRKVLYLISMGGHLLAYLGLLISKDLTATIVIMFFFGYFSVGRTIVGYIYMQEFIPTAYQSVVGTVLQVLSGCNALIGVLYFYCISKYWLYL